MNRLSVWGPVALVAVIVFGWAIWRTPLTNWDEGIYGHVVLELNQRSNWSELTYFNQPFYEKPPLQFWLMTAGVKAFGPNEWTLRIWSVLAGVLVAGLMSVWAARATGRRWAGWLLGLVFVTGRFAVTHAWRSGDVDGLLTLWVVVALLAYWRARRRPRWWLLWGAATGAAIMTKSVAGTIPILVAGLDWLLSQGWRRTAWRWLLGGVGMIMVVAAPWHMLMTVQHGQAFWQTYLNQQVVDRATNAFFVRTPWYWYATAIRSAWWPWGWFVPLAGWLAVRRWWQAGSAIDRFLIVWSGTVLVVFSALESRREWYILAFYPAAAVILARAAVAIWTERKRWMWWATVVSVVAALADAPHALGVAGRWAKLSPFGWLPNQWSHGLLAVIVATVFSVVVGGGLWLVTQRGRRTGWAVAVPLVYVLLLSVGSVWQTARALRTTLPLKTLATHRLLEPIADITVVGIKQINEPAGLFYLRRLPNHIIFAANVPTAGLVLTRDKGGFDQVAAASQRVDRVGPYVLFRVGVPGQ